MSVFTCHTCDHYIDSDFLPCFADNEYNLHCENCVQEMTDLEVISLGIEDEIEARKQ